MSLASESGGMLLILFMVSISSLRSGWIWTKGKQVSGINLSSWYDKSANIQHSSINLIHGPDLQSQLVHHSDEELKKKQEKVTHTETMLDICFNFHSQQQETSHYLSTDFMS